MLSLAPVAFFGGEGGQGGEVGGGAAVQRGSYFVFLYVL